MPQRGPQKAQALLTASVLALLLVASAPDARSGGGGALSATSVDINSEPAWQTNDIPGAWPADGDDQTQVRLDSWTTADGLPLKAVDRVIQTGDRYLWLATQEGLVRFDGYDFRVFEKANSDLRSNAIYSLYEDSRGTLWAGTRNGGLAKVAKGHLETLHAEELADAQVSAMVEEDDGSLLIGLADSTLLRMDPSGSLAPVTEADAAGIRAVTVLLKDDSGAIWIGTRERGLFRMGQNSVTSFLDTEALTHTYVVDLASSGDGSIWVASDEDGIARVQGYRIHTYGQEAGLPVDRIISVYADPNGTVWVGTTGSGVWRFSGGVANQPPGMESASTRTVKDILFDVEGSVWLATNEGLDRVRRARFKTYAAREGLPDDNVYTTLEASDGSIWIGTASGAARLRGGRLTPVLPEMGSVHVLSLAETPDGSIWLGTYGDGLYQYRDGVVHHRTAENGGIPDNSVFALHTGPSGVWLGTRRGAAKLTTGGFDTVTTEDGLSSNDVTVIHETVDRDLWLGTYDGGLNLVRNGEVIGRYLDSDYVIALHEDSDGGIWAGVREGGLHWISNGLTHAFRTEDGMLSDNVLAILEDRDGGMWLTSNVGVALIDRVTLMEYTQGRHKQLKPEFFTVADGLASSEFNGGTQPAGWVGRDGRIWLPSAAGLVSINLAEKNDLPPEVVIERFASTSYDLISPEGLVLDPGEKRFEIDFTAPNFVAPARTNYEFMLDGYDREWITLAKGQDRAAHYTNLPPGEYTFRVRATNGDGVQSSREAGLDFELLPFFWQTLLFKLMCVVAVIAMAWFAYRRRMNKLRERAEELEQLVDERTHDLRLAVEKTEVALIQTEAARLEAETQRELAERAKDVIEAQAEKLREMDLIKTRFFNNISHEFRTPLTLNIGPMENALMGEYGPVTPPMRRQVEVMLRNSRRLLRLINQLLDLSKLESGRMSLKVTEGPLVDLVEGIVLSFTPFAEKKEIDLSYKAPESEAPFLFDALALEKVFFNLLSNAMKFTPDGGEISVEMLQEERQFGDRTVTATIVRVRDTGPGIPEKDQANIFDRFHQVDGTVSKVQEGTGIGLALVKELVELHGGQIAVESTPGHGATFTVALPMDPECLGPHETVVDGYAVGAVNRGPLMEMAVFDGESSEEEEVVQVDENAPRVLVVDDSPDIRQYVADCLSTRYRVTTAEDGQHGLEEAKRLRPDLIVSDVMMPRMNGFELCQAIRAEETVAHVPIVLVTSKASSEDKIEGLEAGADDYVAKPFSARELIARVENLIQVQEQKRSMERLNTDLLSSNAALRQASEMKSQLLSIASHDMKNPLTAIREFARILREENAGAENIELLDMIFDSSNDMLALISQLLDSAAFESGSFRVDRRPTDLVALAERVVERNVRIADRKGQVIQCIMDNPEASRIKVDSERIREAMDNLISNAIKYSPLQSSITVAVTRKASNVVFSVRDEGPGLTDDDKERVFGKFQKLSAKPTGGETSTGLGLSIVKQVVELHGGRVWAENHPDRGTTFIFTLPDVDQAESRDRPAVARQLSSGKKESSASEPRASDATDA